MKQKGMTLIGLVMGMICIAVISLLLIKIIPVYIENYQVKQSLTTVNNLAMNANAADALEAESYLRKSLTKQFDMNGITIKDTAINITPQDLPVYNIDIQYKRAKSLIGNVKLLFEFNEHKEVTVGKQ